MRTVIVVVHYYHKL